MFGKTKENKDTTISYEKALTKKEIVAYGKIVDQFRTGKIDYKTLRDKFIELGVSVDVVLRDQNQIRTVKQAEETKARRSREDYDYDRDIEYFILNSEEFRDVLFYLGYHAVRALADAGIPEYQESMIRVLLTQINHSSNENRELAAKRAVWRREIREYRDALAMNIPLGEKTEEEVVEEQSIPVR